MYNPYDPKDWYWFVAGDRTKVFSSKEGAFVATDDEDYQAFVLAGKPPSTTNSLEDLCGVLNKDIDDEIAAIEATQFRPMRELRLDPSSTYAQNKLKAIDDEIKALRAKRLNPETLED